MAAQSPRKPATVATSAPHRSTYGATDALRRAGRHRLEHRRRARAARAEAAHVHHAVVDAIAARMLEDHDGAVAFTAREEEGIRRRRRSSAATPRGSSKEQHGLSDGLFFCWAAVRFAFVAALAWYYM